MKLRRTILLFLVSIYANTLKSQIYDSDTLKIEIEAKANFIVQNVQDLNINVMYTAMETCKTVFRYNYLESVYKSTFGNCYFELLRWDSINKKYEDITLEVTGNTHPPKEFKTQHEILMYDLDKTELKKNERYTLTFNLLKFTAGLSKGEYLLRFFLRVKNNYGFDKTGMTVTNSIIYLESRIVKFELKKEIKYTD